MKRKWKKRLWKYSLEAGQVFLYLVIVLLCVLGGGIANPHLPISNVTDLGHQVRSFLPGAGPPEENYSKFAVLVFFLFYFVARRILVDARPTYSAGAANVAIVFLLSYYFVFLWLHGALRDFLLLLGVTLPPVIMFISSWAALRWNHHTAHRFLQKIFFPAFASCFLSFCLGWALANPHDGTLDQTDLIYCGFSLSIIILFGVSCFWRNTSAMVATVFTLMLVGTAVVSAAYYSKIGLSLPIALLWTFALGVAEVTKRPHLMRIGDVATGSYETKDFYIAGANWSSIVFFNLLLLMPLFVFHTAMLFVVFVAWGSMIAWHAIGYKDSRFAYRVGLCIGCFLSFAIITLLVLGRIPYPAALEPPPKTEATDRLITLLGIFLTIIFVLYHDVYRKMTGELRASPIWFKSRRNCMLFATLVVAIEAVLLTMGFSVFRAWNGSEEAISQVQFRIDFILICLLAELVIILILLFIGDDDETVAGFELVLRAIQVDGDETRSPMGPSGRRSLAERFIPLKAARTQIALRLARPFNSAIAGLLAFVSAFRLADMDMQSATLVFVATTALCMFGYVVNDIFDREKDRIAGRIDKPVASMLIPMEKVIGLAAALALISLVSGALVGRDVYWATFGGLILVLGYSHFSRALPKLKGLYTAVLCCLPLVIGTGGDMSVLNLNSFMVVVLFIFGREMIIDVTDMRSDEMSKHFTLALTVGAHRAIAIGWLAMLVSAPLMFSIEMNNFGRSLAALAAVSLIGIFAVYRFRQADKVVSLSRIPMLLTIGSFLFQS